MHTVFALLCFVVVMHWLIFPYPSGLLHWHCGNLTIAPVPAKQPWWIWINTFLIPKELISQLQKRQNHAARVITKWRKHDHITPVLVDLHWLPVKQRIDFKILLLTYKALNGLAPAYMRELLIPYSRKRTLRSTENHLLTPPRCRLEYFGKRSFAAAAPILWNNLPLNIKQAPSVDIFKSRIKTHLFQLAYFM